MAVEGTKSVIAFNNCSCIGGNKEAKSKKKSAFLAAVLYSLTIVAVQGLRYSFFPFLRVEGPPARRVEDILPIYR